MSPDDAPVLEARGLRVPGEEGLHGLDLLPPVWLRVPAGEVVVVAGDPGPAHMLLALALAGRLEGAQGLVTLDDAPDLRALRAAVALVDVPGVTEPEPGLPVRTVVGEELATAGRPAGRSAVLQRLSAAEVSPTARLGTLDAARRVRLLLELAVLGGRRFAVLPLPERHGGLPREWAPAVAEVAAGGVGVVVTVSRALAPHVPLGTVVPLGTQPQESA